MSLFSNLVRDQVCITGSEGELSKERLHIVYGADHNFSLGTAVSVFSVLQHNSEIPLHFHLFTDFLSAADLRRYRQLRLSYCFELTIYIVDSKKLHVLPTGPKWTSAIYFRIVAADHLMGRVDKLLYLDSDIVCNGSIESLKHLDLQDCIVAAVLDVDAELSAERSIALKVPGISKGYFNSGFMLINAKQWNESRISDKIAAILQDQELKAAFRYYDQDLINSAVNGRVQLLDEVFNRQYSINDEYKKGNIGKIAKDTVFIHYIGATKPWHLWARCYENVSFFLSAKALSPWKNVLLKMPSSKMLRKHALRHLAFQISQRFSKRRHPASA